MPTSLAFTHFCKTVAHTALLHAFFSLRFFIFIFSFLLPSFRIRLSKLIVFLHSMVFFLYSFFFLVTLLCATYSFSLKRCTHTNRKWLFTIVFSVVCCFFSLRRWLDIFRAKRSNQWTNYIVIHKMSFLLMADELNTTVW